MRIGWGGTNLLGELPLRHATAHATAQSTIRIHMRWVKVGVAHSTDHGKGGKLGEAVILPALGRAGPRVFPQGERSWGDGRVGWRTLDHGKKPRKPHGKGTVVADKGLVGGIVGRESTGISERVGVPKLELVGRAGHGRERQKAQGELHRDRSN